ncbi:uncharacterized protein LOC103720129 isoform X2 [Phoenix dactylifera]|uniref:Uncharacterized protein LOC103720129 isoform X2 n=1 Tax=Phoenix dactylifera TaxID=42345 RepID=A0A8B8JBL3_PHODC|nr:uncharacterized protein LOC103720129 isoform X2 [Phoenix dactylifera]
MALSPPSPPPLFLARPFPYQPAERAAIDLNPPPHRRPAGTAGSGDSPPPTSPHRPNSLLIQTMTAATSSNTSATSTSHPHPHRPSSAAASATQACAACKYQRRKCNRDCTLAPYFPADQQRQFLNAHRLFGVSNILKSIRHLDPVQRAEAMRSIIFQSNARAHDPVGGCYRIILELERQLQRDSAELALVLRQLAICRSQARPGPSPATTAVASDLGVVYPNLILNADDTVGVVLPMHQRQPQQQFCDYFYYDDPHDDHHNNNGKNHHRNYNNRGVVHMEVPTTSMPCEVEEEEEDVKSLVDMFEIRQALIGDDEEESAKNFAAAAAVAEPFQCRLKRTRWCCSQGKIKEIQRIYMPLRSLLFEWGHQPSLWEWGTKRALPSEF